MLRNSPVIRIGTICLGMLWGGFIPDFLPAQTSLRFEWKHDDRQVYVIDQSVRQSLEIFGVRNESEVREQEHRVRRIQQTEQADRFRIDQHAERITYRLLAGDAVQFAFDSRQPEGEDPLKRMAQLRRTLAARAETTWSTLVDTERLEVLAVDGLDQVLKKLEPTLASQLTDAFAPACLAAKEEDWFHGIPLEPVAMGQSWTRRVTHHLGAGQQLHLEYRYTYVGRERRQGQSLDRIDVVVEKAEWSSPDTDPSLLSVQPQTLKVIASNGSLFFDSAAGRVESFRVMMQLRGDVRFKLGRTEDTAKLELEMTSEAQRRIAGQD